VRDGMGFAMESNSSPRTRHDLCNEPARSGSFSHYVTWIAVRGVAMKRFILVVDDEPQIGA